MLLFKKVSDLRKHIFNERNIGKTVGFVPTMGALHQGHISLIGKSIKETDLTVCSIFVNPAQFNENADLKNYPRSPGKDIDLLTASGCHVLFMPAASEVYPDNYKQLHQFDFGYLEQPMEGAHRPGHFQGMAKVVSRLLNIVEPDSLFMGQKDYQQFAIVQEMLMQMNSETKLVMCPIIREKDGLAMSSRNMRLDKMPRLIAPVIFHTLTEAKQNAKSQTPKQIKEAAMEMLSLPGMKLEYFEIVDGKTLHPVEYFEQFETVIACTAAKLGGVRLIDNMVIKS